MKMLTALTRDTGKWRVAGVAYVISQPVEAGDEAGVAYGPGYWPELFGTYQCLDGETMAAVCAKCFFMEGERKDQHPSAREVRALNSNVTEPFAEGLYLKLPAFCRTATDKLQADGFVHGGDAELSPQTTNALDDLVARYKDGSLKATEAIENEINIVTFIKNNRKVGDFDLNTDDFWKPCWVDLLRPLCRNKLILARAQLHLHNEQGDGKLHIDEEREKVVLWNVMISLYDDPAAGSTAVYPPTATVDDAESSRVNPEIVVTTRGKYFIMDANTLHRRLGTSPPATGSERQMLVLTFSDGPVRGADW
jgi:hypothetical protein